MKSVLASIGLSLVLGSFSTSAFAAVWESTRTWANELGEKDEQGNRIDWEQRYSAWVRDKWDHLFFTRPGTPYTGMLLDCADTVYSMRIIFSYENGLPFAMQDPSSRSKVFSNAMTKWDDQPEQGRIRSFLEYIQKFAGTINLPYDTYPVALSRESIRPGGLILTHKSHHHSWTIKDVSDYGVPHLVYSSRPARTQIMSRKGFPSTNFIFAGDMRPGTHAGFRYFRRPEDVGKLVTQVPGYSEEQYSIPAKDWQRAVQAKIALIAETDEQRLERLLNDACLQAQERVKAVDDGIKYLADRDPKACLNAQEYDDYSTPNRDMRLRDAFIDLRDARSSAIGAGVKLSGDLAANLDSVFDPKSKVEYCTIEYADGKKLALRELMRRSVQKLLSDNPHDPAEYRWGEKAGHSARARKCPTYQ